MATTATTRKGKKTVTAKKAVHAAQTEVKSAAKKATRKGKNIAGILGAVLVPVATVAIGYGLSRYYGINMPAKMLGLLK